VKQIKGDLRGQGKKQRNRRQDQSEGKMTKYFCDVCGKSAKGDHGNRIIRQLGKVTIEVMVALNRTWNAGIVCEKCVLKAVNKGKEHPKDRQDT
jgi:DNA-directed RNA polymerase subunit RPC12/RpoP